MPVCQIEPPPVFQVSLAQVLLAISLGSRSLPPAVWVRQTGSPVAMSTASIQPRMPY